MNLAREIADARPRVISALAVQLRDLDLAEDAFADAAAKLIESDEVPDRLAGWLFVVAKRKALDAMRKARVTQGAGAHVHTAARLAEVHGYTDNRNFLFLLGLAHGGDSTARIPGPAAFA